MKKKQKLNQIITTYYYSNNFGALYQAICLRDYIEKINCEKVSFNSYQPYSLLYNELLKPLKTKNFNKFIFSLKKNIKLFFWRKKNKITFPSLFQKTSNSDLNIFGSDEIWNFSNKFNNFDVHFFGHKDNSKKIAYATSIGSANYKKITEEKKKLLKKYLKNFEYISVRDTNTYNFIYDLLNVKPDIVLDPCLLDYKNCLDNIIVKKITKSDYVIIYGTIFEHENIDYIKKFCSLNNYKIYSISYPNDWVDKNYIGINGDEFINFFINSKIIFTSTFHGIVFSCKFKKDFWVSFDKSKYPKYQFFLNYIDLENRFLNLNSDLNKQINYNNVEEKINKLRITSQKFLKDAFDNLLKI